jgi:hypothetical protein
LFYELLPEIAKVGNRPAKRGQAEPQEEEKGLKNPFADGQFVIFLRALVIAKTLAWLRLVFHGGWTTEAKGFFRGAALLYYFGSAAAIRPRPGPPSSH